MKDMKMKRINSIKKRNPIARCCRVNISKAIPSKKGKGAVYKRVKRLIDEY